MAKKSFMKSTPDSGGVGAMVGGVTLQQFFNLCSQFRKHFTVVTYGPSKISKTIHCMRVTMQCCQKGCSLFFNQCDQIGQNFAIWLLSREYLITFLHKKELKNMIFCSYCNIQSRVTRLCDFSPIRLLFVDSLKEQPKNGNSLVYKFITFSPKYAV